MNDNDNDNESEVNSHSNSDHDHHIHYCRPKWILVENVKGFFGSDMLNQWYECLDECGYTFEEYLLSPTQLGIPNNRTRYYMVAERSNRFFGGRNNNCPSTDIPSHEHSLKATLPPMNNVDYSMVNAATVKPISNYIQHFNDENEQRQYMVPDNIFDKEWVSRILLKLYHSNSSDTKTN